MRLAETVACRILRRAGYEMKRPEEAGLDSEFPTDFDTGMQDVCRMVRPFTMTSPERLFALRQSVQYLIRRGVQGDIVECGVWNNLLK